MTTAGAVLQLERAHTSPGGLVKLSFTELHLPETLTQGVLRLRICLSNEILGAADNSCSQDKTLRITAPQSLFIKGKH